MTDLDDINDAIVDATSSPARVKVADQEVESRNIDDLIKAANHVASQSAATTTGLGLRFIKLVPPGGG